VAAMLWLIRGVERICVTDAILLALSIVMFAYLGVTLFKAELF